MADVASPTTKSTLPSTPSLRVSAAQAAQKGQPLVVMTTIPSCPYCDLVRNAYLGPMTRAGEVEAVQINIRDQTGTFEDFSSTTTPRAWSQALKAKLAPTVFFFGPNGEELAERLVGVAVPELYGDYLQARLTESRKKLATRRP
jgi:thioredoxin-related protein